MSVITTTLQSNVKIAYRVIDITDNNLKTDRTTYCGPYTGFWLSLRGLENPNADMLIAEIGDSKGPFHGFDVEFNYDGGRYKGNIWYRPRSPLIDAGALKLQGRFQNVDANISEISSL